MKLSTSIIKWYLKIIFRKIKMVLEKKIDIESQILNSYNILALFDSSAMSVQKI